jgi:hypothetical protein
MDDFGTIGLPFGIKAKQHPHYFSPICSLLLGHQQPQVDSEMSLVIRTYAIGKWWPLSE